ncbi:hypothetical protein [Halomonas denitrificans]|uniref:hypothetical protein n=1 Tax=Halomonas denitrificans TaxID=370769 RepID=UPI001475BDA5|nr:hypothetical protein [Halomonas denitrificans]
MDLSNQAPMLPAELLQAVVAHEDREAQRYRWRALRFLTYHPGLSRLMEALADESRDRREVLIEALTGERPAAPGQAAAPGECASPGAAHFFIVDDDTALLELSRSLLEARRTARFYARLRRGGAIPGVDGLLGDCVTQCRAHARLLEETRRALPVRRRSLGSVARGRRCRRRIG